MDAFAKWKKKNPWVEIQRAMDVMSCTTVIYYSSLEKLLVRYHCLPLTLLYHTEKTHDELSVL